MHRKTFAYPYIVWMVLFTVLPLFLVFYYAFTTPQGAFTVENFAAILQPSSLRALWRSLYLSLICTGICLAIGYPAAMMLAVRDMKRSTMLLLLFVLPMWMNFLLRTYAWVVLLERDGIVNMLLGFMGLGSIDILYTPTAVVLGMVYNFLPFMILPIYTTLERMDKSLIEASYDLGAPRYRTFWKVIFPLSLPGVASGITMVFMPAASLFVISRLLGGGKTAMIGDMIEAQFIVLDNRHLGSMYSIVLMAVILLGMALLSKYDKDSASGRGLW